MSEEKKIPAGIIFAAVIMFAVGLFSLVSAIAAFSSVSWLSDLKADLGGNLTWMAVIDLVLAVGYVIAGYSILKGGKFGYYWAIIFAVVNATKWFFLIPWNPIMSILVIALDVLVIFAITANPEHFGIHHLGYYSRPPREY